MQAVNEVIAHQSLNDVNHDGEVNSKDLDETLSLVVFSSYEDLFLHKYCLRFIFSFLSHLIPSFSKSFF